MNLIKRLIKKEYIPLYIGISLMSVFVAFSLSPSLIAPYHPKEMFAAWQGISSAHILGTNDMGYDIFSELVYASSTTLVVGITAALVSLLIGSVIGIMAGYLTGWKGEILDGLVNVFLLIPMLPMAIVVAAFLGPGINNIILIIATLGWCATARAGRAKTKQLKQTNFVESLVILGIPRWQIMLKHIFPNLTEIVLAKYIMSVGSFMLMEAPLSFLGLGDPTKVTWGGMLNLAYKCGGFSKGALNWYLPPGICIALCVLAFFCVNYYFEKKASQVEGDNRSYLD